MEAEVNTMMQQMHLQQNGIHGGMYENKSPTLGSGEMVGGGDQALQQPGAVKKKTTGPIHNPRYKSILCDHWERNNGTCPYAEKCQFAHGPAELAKWQAHRARQQQIQQVQQQPVQQQPQAQHVIQVNPAQFTSPQKMVQSHPQHVVHSQVQMQQQYAMNGGYAMGGATYLHSKQPTPMKPDAYVGYPPELYAAYAQQSNMTSPQQMYSAQAGSMTISPSQNVQIGSNNMYSPLPSPQYPQQPQHQQPQPQYMYNGSKPQSIGNPRSPSPAMYSANGQEAMYNMRNGSNQQRHTPVGSLSSTPPGASPFPMLNYPQQHTSSRRSVSPDDQSLELRSHQDPMDAVPRSDPRRTASLPQLFSRDFLASLSADEQMQQRQQSQHAQMGHQQRGMGIPVGDLTVDTLLAQNLNNSNAQSRMATAQSPPLVHYPSYRRGSAPPVVLSVVTNSLGDYNSLADLDSLADELVSEPATSASASQLFNMPTVFPGSIKGSINEYL